MRDMKRCAIYSRISQDQAGEGKGVERQREDCEALAKARGYEVSGFYEDNDITAAGPVKKQRPSYNAMLAAARAKEFDVIVAYSNSRLTRRPRELEDLIELHNQYGTTIVTVVSGEDDLSTADGRLMARLKAGIDAAEADRTAERTKRWRKQQAQSGEPVKGRYRAFGYNRDFTLHKDEAPLASDAFKRVAAGESIQSIVNEWNAKGITTTGGRRWRGTGLRALLTNPRYAGLSVYEGQVVGKTNYPAITDEATFNAIKDSRTKRGAGHNARKYLLSGIVVCSKCHRPMYGVPDKYTVSYKCKVDDGGCGRVGIKAQWADDAVTHEVLRLLNEEPIADNTGAVEAASAAIEAVDKRIADLQGAYDSGDLDLADLLPMLKGERAKRAQLVKDAAAVRQQDNVVVKTIKTFDDWQDASLSAKRVTIAKYVQAVMVLPHTGKPSRNFNPERLLVVGTDGQQWTPTMGTIVERIVG